MIWVRVIIAVGKVLLILGIVDIATGNIVPELMNSLGHIAGKSMMSGGKS